MNELSFAVLDAAPDRTAMVPTLRFELAIDGFAGERVQSILLRVQVRIEPDQRRYDDGEGERITDLFGERERWADTMHAFPLTHETLPVPGFDGGTQVDLPVELSYDLEVAAGKYLHALRDGEVPLLFLFSGTVYLHAEHGLSVRQVPWDLEARYRLPVTVWRDLMDLHYPGTGWLRLRRDTIDRLVAYKTAHTLPTWDDTLAHLLDPDGARR